MVSAELGGHEERGHAEAGREGASQGHRRVHVDVRACLLLYKAPHDDPAMQKVAHKPCGCKLSTKECK